MWIRINISSTQKVLVPINIHNMLEHLVYSILDDSAHPFYFYIHNRSKRVHELSLNSLDFMEILKSLKENSLLFELRAPNFDPFSISYDVRHTLNIVMISSLL